MEAGIPADIASSSLEAFLEEGVELQRDLSDEVDGCSRAVDDLLSAAGEVERLGRHTNPYTAKRRELEEGLEQKQQEVEAGEQQATNLQQEVSLCGDRWDDAGVTHCEGLVPLGHMIQLGGSGLGHAFDIELVLLHQGLWTHSRLAELHAVPF